MSTVAEIEYAVRALPIDDARNLADWLQDYLEERWDQQIECDALTGKLDKLAAQALAHHRSGNVKSLDEVINHS